MTRNDLIVWVKEEFGRADRASFRCGPSIGGRVYRRRADHFAALQVFLEQTVPAAPSKFEAKGQKNRDYLEHAFHAHGSDGVDTWLLCEDPDCVRAATALLGVPATPTDPPQEWQPTCTNPDCDGCDGCRGHQHSKVATPTEPTPPKLIRCSYCEGQFAPGPDTHGSYCAKCHAFLTAAQANYAPTEPTPPPVVGRCKTCKHFHDYGTGQADCRRTSSLVWADGSGFCHLHEAAK